MIVIRDQKSLKVLHKVQHSFLSFLNNMELYHGTE